MSKPRTLFKAESNGILPQFRIRCWDETSLGSYAFYQKKVDGAWVPLEDKDYKDLLNLVANTLIGKIKKKPIICDHWGP